MTVPDASEPRSAPHDPDPLNDLLWEVTTYVELLGEAALAATPLTLPSSGVLIAVDAEPGITVAEMARRVPKSQQALSQVAARLEKLGLIERRLGSGRGVGLFATAQGRAMAETCRRCERELDAQVRQLLGDRYDTLQRLLAESRAILRQAR